MEYATSDYVFAIAQVLLGCIAISILGFLFLVHIPDIIDRIYELSEKWKRGRKS